MDKTYLKRAVVWVLTAAISLVAIVYLIYHIFALSDKGFVTEPVQSAVWEESIQLSGTVLREEKVLFASSDGEINRLLSDGERTGANAAVATVYTASAGYDPELLVELDKKIRILEKSNDVTASDYDLSYTDARIEKLYYSVRLAQEAGDLEYAASLSERLLILLNKREIIVRSRLNFDTELAELYEQRKALLQGSEHSFETVYTSDAGYFFKDADGFEGIYDPELLKLADYGALTELFTKERAETDRVAGKIVTAADWYIVAFVSPEHTKLVTEGKTYTLEFPDSSSERIPFTLERTVVSEDGKNAAFILRTDVMPEDFSYSREQNFDLIYESESGLCVPDSALRVSEDGRIGVYILKDNKTTFREIDIITEKEGYCLVIRRTPDTVLYETSLHLYDRIITEGKGIKEQFTGGDIPYSEAYPDILIKP